MGKGIGEPDELILAEGASPFGPPGSRQSECLVYQSPSYRNHGPRVTQRVKEILKTCALAARCSLVQRTIEIAGTGSVEAIPQFALLSLERLGVKRIAGV